MLPVLLGMFGASVLALMALWGLRLFQRREAILRRLYTGN